MLKRVLIIDMRRDSDIQLLIFKESTDGTAVCQLLYFGGTSGQADTEKIGGGL